MTISIGYILGHLCEFLLFIYFANTSFYPRKNYIISSLISLCGYLALFGIGLLGIAPISIIAFFIINSVLLIYCYNVKFRSAVFYSLILDTLSCIGEYIVIYIIGLRYDNGLGYLAVTPPQMIIISSGGKLIYLIGVIFLKLLTNQKTVCDSETPTILTVIPILSITCLVAMMSMEMDTLLFIWFSIVFLAINFTSFYINVGINEKDRELKAMHAELYEYQLLAEKHENTKIIQHDLYKHLEVLKNLIDADNVKAKEYMRQIRFSQRELDYTQYTDNKILNILFAQKVKECHEKGIEIHIHSKAPTLSFISDIDTVAIFSNMLDNAIEASENSVKKEIFVDLYTVNNSYAAVKVENYTDKEPIILGGELRTHKENTELHGIGVKSINNALKKYNSELTWNYDKERKFFRAMVLIAIHKADI